MGNGSPNSTSLNVFAKNVKYFNPMSPFFTNYFVETKGFTNRELTNHGSPYYFYSIPFLLLIVLMKNLFDSLGEDPSSAILAFLGSFNLIYILFIKNRSFIMMKTAYFFSGLFRTYEVILRTYWIQRKGNDGKTNTNTEHSRENFFGAIIGSFAALIGQEIVFKTGSYEINLILNIFVNMFSACVFAYSCIANRVPAKPMEDSNLFSKFIGMDSKKIKIFYGGAVLSCYNIFIKLFIQNLIRDQGKQAEIKANVPMVPNAESGDPASKPSEGIAKCEGGTMIPNANSPTEIEVSNVDTNITKEDIGKLSKPTHVNSGLMGFLEKINPIKLLMVLIRHISTLFIAPVVFFFPSYECNLSIKNIKKPSASGYVDAVINISCACASYLIDERIPVDARPFYYRLFLFLCPISLLSMTFINYIPYCYFNYLFILIFSKLATNICKGLLKDADLSVCGYLFQSLLHITINIFCAYREFNSLIKARIYGFMGVIVFIFVFCYQGQISDE